MSDVTGNSERESRSVAILAGLQNLEHEIAEGMCLRCERRPAPRHFPLCEDCEEEVRREAEARSDLSPILPGTDWHDDD